MKGKHTSSLSGTIKLAVLITGRAYLSFRSCGSVARASYDDGIREYCASVCKIRAPLSRSWHSSFAVIGSRSLGSWSSRLLLDDPARFFPLVKCETLLSSRPHNVLIVFRFRHFKSNDAFKGECSYLSVLSSSSLIDSLETIKRVFSFLLNIFNCLISKVF